MHVGVKNRELQVSINYFATITNKTINVRVKTETICRTDHYPLHAILYPSHETKILSKNKTPKSKPKLPQYNSDSFCNGYTVFLHKLRLPNMRNRLPKKNV